MSREGERPTVAWFERADVRVYALPVGAVALWVAWKISQHAGTVRSDAGTVGLIMLALVPFSIALFSLPIAIGWERFFRYWPED
jgi:hypothetical protein